jgi:O-antigen/teichoic acid export membrane protein
MINKIQQQVKGFIKRYQENIFLKRLSTVLLIDIFVKLSGFVLLPVFLRLMTQDEFGLYNYILSILNTFSLVLNFGLYIPLTKFYHDSKNPKERGKLLYTLSVTLVITMCVTLIPLYLLKIDYWFVKLLFQNPIDYQSYRFVIFFSLLATIFSFMLTNYFYSAERIGLIKKYNIARIIAINIFVVGALYFIPGDKANTRLIFTYAIEFILFCFFLRFLVKKFVPRFDRDIAVKSLKMGFPIMLSAIMGIVINFSDKFFLERYGDFKTLSQYYLAISFAGIIPVIFTSIQNAWLPLFMKEKNLKTNLSKTNQLFKKLFIVFTGIGIVIWLLFFTLLRTGIIPSKYAEVVYILPILLVTNIFAALTPILSNYMIYFQKTYIVSLTGLFVCIISMLSSYFFIRRWNIYGAAVASLVANITYLLIYYIIVKSLAKKYLIHNPDSKITVA